MDIMYQKLNDSMVALVNDYLCLEKAALLSSEFEDISMNDVHIIEAVGIGEIRNMSTIAHALSVTVGSLTTAMNSLVRKGYVQRERSEMDRRVVFIRLTDKGRGVFERHYQYHMQMTKDITAHVPESDMQKLMDQIQSASCYLKECREKQD